MPDNDETPLDRQLELMRFQNERLKIKLAFWKFIFGTAAVSILTAVLNWQIQTKQLEHEIKSKENEFIAQFIDHALDDSPEKRRDFAEYFFRLTPSEEAQGRWKEYRKYTKALVEASLQTSGLIEVSKRELEEALEAPGSASRVPEIEAELSAHRQELAALRSEPSPEGGSSYPLAVEKEREGFEALLADDIERAIDAFEAAESAYPEFHQVYEIGRSLRRHRADPDARRKVMREIVDSYSWKAPSDLLEEIKSELGI